MTARGRPTAYTEEKALYICQQIAQGRSLVSICNDEGMPCLATVYNWIKENRDFLDRYAIARQDQADHLADEMIDIADFCDDSHEGIAKARLRIDARKWVAAKLKPKKYGERVEHDHTGSIALTKTDEDIISDFLKGQM